jgi:hypothetical protein
VSYALANLRKYGSNWRSSRKAIVSQRLSSWGFAGSGKWTSSGQGLAVNPVLVHSAVPNVVKGGHPDVWDPNILAQLTTTLTSQIGSGATNPYIIGWSVGNEKDEVIGVQEVQAMLALGAGVPAKKALIDHALTVMYSGSISTLATAWQIAATTAADIYAAKPTPPPQDIETLRQFYEGYYHSILYKTVKTIDPHHLYLGSWTQPRLHATDWPIMAANCDVVGFDFYSPTFLDPSVQAHEEAGAGRRVLLPFRLRRHAWIWRGQLSGRNHSFGFAVRRPVCAVAPGRRREPLRGGRGVVRIRRRARYRTGQQRWLNQHLAQPGAGRKHRVRTSGRC